MNKDLGHWTIPKGEVRQKSGKLVLAWAARGDLDAATAVSNTYGSPSTRRVAS